MGNLSNSDRIIQKGRDCRWIGWRGQFGLRRLRRGFHNGCLFSDALFCSSDLLRFQRLQRYRDWRLSLAGNRPDDEFQRSLFELQPERILATMAYLTLVLAS